MAMSFCMQGRSGSLITPQALAMCRMWEGTKSMTKNKPAGHGRRGAAHKNAGAMEDFWELRGLVLAFTRCLKAYRFPGFRIVVLLHQFIKITEDKFYIFILMCKRLFYLLYLKPYT